MSAIALPYAKALYKANREAIKNNIEQDVTLLQQIFSQEKKFLHKLSSPHNQKQKVELLTEGMSLPIINLCKILLKNNRVNLLPEITDKFLELVKKDRGEIDITITSTTPISTEIGERIKRSFNSDKEVKITNLIDQSIIGGIILRIGNKILDLSLKNKLKELEEMSNREVLKCN